MGISLGWGRDEKLGAGAQAAASSQTALGHVPLHVVAQLAEPLALGPDPGLVLGGIAQGSFATFLRLTRSALLCGQLVVATRGRDGRAQFGDEVPARARAIKPAQVAHRATTYTLGPQAPSEFVQERLRLAGTRTQQHARGGAFLGQHLRRKDKITTTTGDNVDAGRADTSRQASYPQPLRARCVVFVLIHLYSIHI
jgi:hypothetical protein